MGFDPIDIPALLAPIAGEEPAGASGIFEILDRLRSDRKAIIQPRDGEASPGANGWDRIVVQASDTLASTSKHLQVAVRLVEALTRRDGFTGLRDGFKLLRSLCAECWDRMYPELDPSDPAARSDPFEYLNDRNAGALMPIIVKTLPIFSSEDGEFSWNDLNAKPPTSGDRKETDAFTERQKKIKKAQDLATRQHCEKLTNIVKGALDELDALVVLLTEKIGRNDAPGLGDLRDSIAACHVLIAGALKDKGGPTQTEETPTAGEETPVATDDAPAGDQPAAAPVRRSTITRSDVYQRLAESADLLEKMEPHSPVPHLIRRAVELGSLPFPQLMRALIADGGTVDNLHKGLGIKEEGK